MHTFLVRRVAMRTFLVRRILFMIYVPVYPPNKTTPPQPPKVDSYRMKKVDGGSYDRSATFIGQKKEFRIERKNSRSVL
jgi:hypothetical protein